MTNALQATTAPPTDPYRWLEDPYDPKALAWAAEKSSVTVKGLQALPQYDDVLRELERDNAQSGPTPDYAFAGDYLLRLNRTDQKPYGVLAVSQLNEGQISQWRDVLDMSELRDQENVGWELHLGGAAILNSAPGHSRIMIPLSVDGSDEVELREFDLKTGGFVEGGFHVPSGRNGAVWLDKDTLLLQHTVGDAARLPTGWPRDVSIWLRHTPLASATVVFRAAPGDSLMMLSQCQADDSAVGVIECWRDYSTVDTFLVRFDGQVRATEIPRHRKMGLGLTAGSFVIALPSENGESDGRRYVAESVLAYDVRESTPNGSRLHTVFEPAEDEFIIDSYFGISSGQSSLAFVIDSRARQRVDSAKWDGRRWNHTSGPDEEIGTAVSFVAGARFGAAYVTKRAGFLSPARLELVCEGVAPIALFEQPLVIGGDGFSTELRTAMSPDGTEIDFYLVGPKNHSPHEGAIPVLFTGYGAFGISLSPDYFGPITGGNSLAAWLRRGGALAVPLIRGGGERGAAWHQAAMREGRQRSYDDFAAVMVQLINDGYTSAERTGVFGTSNGGLLAAVMGTQRPDLCGAIVSDVPLTDLIRLASMGMGAAWLNEYGNPDDPEMRDILMKYSPYQALKEQDYPPFLVTVATSDDRVGPGHARKLTAALHDFGAEALLIEDQAGGHAVSDALQNPEMMAARMAFFLSRLM